MIVDELSPCQDAKLPQRMTIDGYATGSEISDTSTPFELCAVAETGEGSELGEKEEM
jgi:hypothetical protein